MRRVIEEDLYVRAPRVPRDDRYPPLTAFGMTLLLNLLGWTGVYELVRLVRWTWGLVHP